MRPRALFPLIFLGVLGTRLCHLDILWIEECYPAAGALQLLHGTLPYSGFWFDKPPLSMAVYLLWGAYPGFPLRLAGALFVTLVSWLCWRFARELWGESEGLLAAALSAFFLTFGIPSAVMALAPDLLMVAPQIAAVYLAWRKRPFPAGVMAGVAMLIHSKGLYVLAACLIWQYRAFPALAAGFLVPNLLFAGFLAATGGLGAYWEQVWRWGFLYARDTFVLNPLSEGARRFLDWAGFHAALVAGAIWFWKSGSDPERRRLALWLGLSAAGVAAGWRFFPRYFFQLLPVMILVASRGLVLLGRKRMLAALALLLIPLVRFGPRYGQLGTDLLRDRPHQWRDLAMYEGSAAAARVVNQLAGAGDTLFVWGYRPDLYVLTRLRAGTPFLDSQPVTGVIADRHLTNAKASAPRLAARNRQRLAVCQPSFIIDGLGPYNPALSITRFPDLKGWLDHYTEIARTPSTVIYRRRGEPPVSRERPAPTGIEMFISITHSYP